MLLSAGHVHEVVRQRKAKHTDVVFRTHERLRDMGQEATHGNVLF